MKTTTKKTITPKPGAAEHGPLVENHLVQSRFDDSPQHFADCCIIVIGNNHCWGKGDTLSEALRNASRPSKYIAYIGKNDTTVSEMDGALTWSKGFAPREIDRKGWK